MWAVRNQGDGTAQIVEAGGEGRCLALSPIGAYPPPVWVDQCGNQPDRWTITGRPDAGPVAITLGAGGQGSLTTQGSRAVVSFDGGPQWILQRLG